MYIYKDAQIFYQLPFWTLGSTFHKHPTIHTYQYQFFLPQIKKYILLTLEYTVRFLVENFSGRTLFERGVNQLDIYPGVTVKLGWSDCSVPSNSLLKQPPQICLTITVIYWIDWLLFPNNVPIEHKKLRNKQSRQLQ